MKDAGLALSGYCRGGFFPAADAAGLRAALEDNRQAVDEAKTLGAPCLVLVVGSLPGALAGKPASKDIGLARTQVFDGIAATLEYAQAASACRSPSSRCIPCRPPSAPASTRWSRRSTSATRSIPAAPARSASPLDVYHVWWDPKLESQIARAGPERLLAYHVCDWLVPTRDLLNDRGMMGDGIVELQQDPRLGRGRRLHRPRRGRDLLRPLVDPPRRRGPRHLHRALQDGGVILIPVLRGEG